MNDPGHQRPATLPDLIAALTALSDTGAVERARAIPGLIETAKGVLAAERADAMARAVADGMSQAELGRQLGITRQQISKTLAERKER